VPLVIILPLLTALLSLFSVDPDIGLKFPVIWMKQKVIVADFDPPSRYDSPAGYSSTPGYIFITGTRIHQDDEYKETGDTDVYREADDGSGVIPVTGVSRSSGKPIYPPPVPPVYHLMLMVGTSRHRFLLFPGKIKKKRTVFQRGAYILILRNIASRYLQVPEPAPGGKSPRQHVRDDQHDNHDPVHP
jgi:hypothetical protein